MSVCVQGRMKSTRWVWSWQGQKKKSSLVPKKAAALKTADMPVADSKDVSTVPAEAAPKPALCVFYIPVNFQSCFTLLTPILQTVNSQSTASPWPAYRQPMPT